MIMKANKQIGFIYKNEESIDKILKDGDVVFERGFLREKTSTTLPITFGGVGKDLKDYRVYGNTYQNTTSGKNLFDYEKSTIYTAATEKLIIDDEQAFKRKQSYNNPSMPNIWPNIYTQDIVNYEEGKKYTISYNIWSDSAVNFNTQLLYINASTSTSHNLTAITPTKQRLIGTVTYHDAASASLHIYPTVTADNNYYISNVQIEEGDTATEYEPYTGGQPSPNPDYPQEMVSCGDRTKNLIGFDDLTETTSNGVTYSIKDNVFTLNGTATDNIRCLMTDNWILKNAGNYTLKIDVISGTWTAGIIGLSLRNANLAQETYHQVTYDTSNLTITKEYTEQNINNTVRIGFFINKNSVFSNFKFRIILNEGSTATLYEPYGYKIPVNVRSDNLFDNNDTSILLKAYISPTNLVSNNNSTTLFVNCKPNTTYTITRSIIGKRFGVGTTDIIPVAGDSINNVEPSNVNNELSTITYTTNSTAKYLCVFYSNTGGNNLVNNNGHTEEELRNSLQIVEGSTVPTKFQPYYNETTNIYLDEPLRKIGDYVDNIDFINGKVVRKIGEIVLNGSENWGKSSKTGVNRYYLKNVILVHLNRYTIDLISDYFKCISPQSSDDDSIGLAKYNANGFMINFELTDTNFDTLSKFLDWLSTHNTTVYYVLATPTEESITLPNIPTIDGNNTLNIETEITPSQVYIKYKSNE